MEDVDRRFLQTAIGRGTNERQLTVAFAKGAAEPEYTIVRERLDHLARDAGRMRVLPGLLGRRRAQHPDTPRARLARQLSGGGKMAMQTISGA